MSDFKASTRNAFQLVSVSFDLNVQLKNLLKHTLLFWYFLENLKFEIKILWNTLEQCFQIIHGYFQRQLTQNIQNIDDLVENLLKKTKVENLPFFKEINTEKEHVDVFHIFMRYDLFSKASRSVFSYSENKNNYQTVIFYIFLKLYRQTHTQVIT